MSPHIKHHHLFSLSILAVITTTATTATFVDIYNNKKTRNQQQQQQQPSSEKPNFVGTSAKMAVTTPFQTLFAVPMHCESCANDISSALHKLQGITKVEPNVKEQLVTIEGTAPPSAIVEVIQATGRDAILRGSGTSNSAAVSILETYYHRHLSEAQPSATPTGAWVNQRLVRGLARLVQVSPTKTVIDLTVRGLPAGKYTASIREYGNLAAGATSTGPVWAEGRGKLGEITIDDQGKGAVFLSSDFAVWEAIGHALLVTSTEEKDGGELKNDEGTAVGIIARSAGVWDNDKTVCSCTGKTLWEERRDEVGKGML
ncbi:superoxide dismutase [Podospora fimiseda]|uniref:Superoxide dismutase 1 copper chaperone n=1 Tax=Podospora fimiseda TaxID=252190 RepID=A0AAN7BMJ7_9PEZI|nr:superoxide dismutase [Podospora fimiseda]